MAGRYRLPLLLFPLLILAPACNAQVNTADRQPAVAGQFYPGTAGELRQELTNLFSRALPSQHLANVVAVIVPHAGYPFSGSVAASGFDQIDPGKEYENIFVIGPSHHVGFEGAAVYAEGDFLMPLGRVKVNRELGGRLARENPVFSTRTDAHANEHSVEVQLPFLQTILKKPFQIVPIVVGANAPATCRKIADALRPYFNEKNLFVISTDFSHYPAYDDAVRTDRSTAHAILTGSPDSLLATLQKNAEAGIPNLATSLCGWSAVLTLLYMTGGTGATYTEIEYRNSGDAGITDKRSVVGYWALAVSRPAKVSGFNLGEKDRAKLLTIARETVASYTGSRQVPSIDPATLSDALKTPCGAFVTLNEGGSLRGCIGRFDASEPLYSVVQQMAVAAATQDPRFRPVEGSEVKSLDIEISVLTPMRRIQSIDEFELGKHGIYIKKGFRSGTFLPQVAVETGWTREEFLGHCAQDKAGIGWDGWKDAELYVYEALVFGEK